MHRGRRPRPLGRLRGRHDGWSVAAHVGPEVELEECEYEVETSGEQAAAGERSLRIWNEGDYDDGTTWVSHEVPVESGRAYDATVSAQFWSESESFDTLRNAVLRLGPEPAEVEEDVPAPAG